MKLNMIKNAKQLDKVELDLESPTLKQAMVTLGVTKQDLVKKYTLCNDNIQIKGGFY